MLLITVALMTPAIAEAASIKIWPDQLKPTWSNSDYYQDVTNARNGTFTAPISLPAGARLSKITYYHWGNDRVPPAMTYLIFFRIKMGNESEELGIGSSQDSTGEIIPVDVQLTGDLIIRAGYRYYIEAYSGYPESYFLGVKIDYQK